MTAAPPVLRAVDVTKIYGPTVAVARAIVRALPLRTVGDLRRVVTSVVRRDASGIDPATRTFQALRIYVNDELFELAEALAAAERILAPGGKLVVVSFHSLEDRLVKTFLAARSSAPALRLKTTFQSTFVFCGSLKRRSVRQTSRRSSRKRSLTCGLIR